VWEGDVKKDPKRVALRIRKFLEGLERSDFVRGVADQSGGSGDVLDLFGG